MKSNIHNPSFRNGFARNACESESPNLWRGLRNLVAPVLGNTGSLIHDVARKTRYTETNVGSGWSMSNVGPVILQKNYTIGVTDSFISASLEHSILAVWLNDSDSGRIATYESSTSLDGMSLLCRSDGFAIDIVEFSVAYSGTNLIVRSHNLYPDSRNLSIARCCLITRRANTARMFLNGSEVIYTLKQDGVGSPASLVGYRTFLWHDGYTGLIGVKRAGILAVWSRCLSGIEARLLSADPLKLLRRNARKSYFSFSGGSRIRQIIAGAA
jgi:hypothetical protein